MTRCKSTTNEVNTMARLIKAEALGEGAFGMSLVGNVIINRVVAKCNVFRRTGTITKVIFQRNAFSGTKSALFRTGANRKQKDITRRCIKYWRGFPATSALYFNAPGRGKPCQKNFYGPLIGKYKNHCFYRIRNTRGCGV